MTKTYNSKDVQLGAAESREARSECLEIVETLQHGIENGTLCNAATQLLLMVLRVHLLALGFERIQPPVTNHKP